MFGAYAEPIELANAVKDDPTIVTTALTAFEGWCEAEIPDSEDKIKNYLIKKIDKLNINLIAERFDNSEVDEGKKPDIWVYPKKRTASPYIIIEALKKNANESMWHEHVNRKYISESGITFYSNGIIFKSFYNGCEYFEFDFKSERHRILFTAFLKNSKLFEDKKPKYKYIEIFDIEKKLAQNLSSLLRKIPEGRILVAYLISVGTLEHSGLLNSNFIDKMATHENPDIELQNLLRQKQPFSILENLRKIIIAKDITNRTEICLTTLTYKNKIISFRNMDAYSLSRMYEYVFSMKERKTNGIYATPKSICTEIAKKAYRDLTCNEDKKSHSIKVGLIDISCGSGNFLEAIIAVLCEKVNYDNFNTGIERRHRYKFTVVGRDVNIEATCFAEAATILALYKRHLSPEFTRNPLEIEFKFDVGDGSDIADVEKLATEYDYCLWLGNPPFVKQTRMANSTVTSKTGKKNLGTIFLETMLQISSAKSVIGVIYQMALIGSQCKNVQTLLDQKVMKVNHFVYFGTSHLFTNLPAHKWCYMVLSPYTHKKTFKNVARITKHASLINIDEQIKSVMEAQPEQILTEDLKLNDYLSFRMVTTHDRELAEILCNMPRHKIDREQGIFPSSEFFDGDACFQVDEKFKMKLTDYEKTFLKPYWNETYQKDFYIEKNTSFLIDIPKSEFVTNVTKIKKTETEKLKESEEAEKLFAEKAPNIYGHLIKFRHLLMKARERKNGSLFFWNLHWGRGGKIYIKDKVVIPQMLNWSYPILAYIDVYGVGVPFSFNIIKGRDGYRENWQEALVGWLNSGVIAFYLNGMNGAKPRGQGGEITGEILDALPIPTCILYKSKDVDEEKNVIDLINVVIKTRGKFVECQIATQNTIDRICTEILTFEIIRQEKIKEISIYSRDDWKIPS